MLRVAEQRVVSEPFLGDLILAFMASAHGRPGQWDEGLERVEEGIAMAGTNLERVFAAELCGSRANCSLDRRAERSVERTRSQLERQPPLTDASVLLWRSLANRRPRPSLSGQR